MSESDLPSFHVRLPPRLKERLQASKGSNSLNREIVERLEQTFEDPDFTYELAKIFRPLMRTLSEEDQKTLMMLTAAVIAVLAKGRPRKGR